jgi:polysaccharide export outer membrane protein
MRSAIAGAVVITSATLSGAVPPAQAPAAAADGCSAAYVIGPDDVLDVSVWKNTEISRTVPVRPDGRISLPLLNDIQAAGLMPMELRDKIAAALQPYMAEPSVSVLVREVHSVKVTIIGDVKAPGRYEIKDRATVLDVLAMAGGFTEFADRDAIVVLRQEAGRTRQLRVDYGRLTSKNPNGSNGAALNFCVRAGDVVVVP